MAKKEVNSDPDNSFSLFRPTSQHIYRVLKCECGNDTLFEIALTDNGHWCIECLACRDAACMFSDLINKLR